MISEHEYERRKREQGGCSTGDGGGNLQSRFTIPAGTVVSIAKVSGDRRWMKYTTKRELGFEKYELCHTGAYTFREEGWLILVKCSKVTRRERTELRTFS